MIGGNLPWRLIESLDVLMALFTFFNPMEGVVHAIRQAGVVNLAFGMQSRVPLDKQTERQRQTSVSNYSLCL